MNQIVRREPQAPVEEKGQYLTFTLGEEMFAVGILTIREIIEYGSVTTVPLMPAFVRGVINLRGSMVPVIDLSARLGRQPCRITRRSCIVIMELNSGGDRQELGIAVDAVCEVLEIAAGEIELRPSFGTKLRSDFIAGMGKVDDRFVILLDMSRVLDVDELALVTRAGEQEVALLEHQPA